jgi:predicted nucleotide-binding protein
MPDRRIPLPQANAELTERIRLGQELLNQARQGAFQTRTQKEATWDEAVQWHDYNRTWLGNSLGGDIQAEYQAVTSRTYEYSNPPSKLGILQRSLPREIAKLESIRDRLPLWPGPDEAAEAGRHTAAAPDRKAVMVIYGHDYEANTALFGWLRDIGLEPREWDDLVRATGSASPYVGDVLDQAFRGAQAVVAFFTPDERVSPKGRSEPVRLQARPNVLIEAGMALVTHPSRTVLAVLGPQELPSDLAGRHYIRLSHTAQEPLRALAARLRDAGCDVDLGGTGWLDPGRFPDRSPVGT